MDEDNYSRNSRKNAAPEDPGFMDFQDAENEPLLAAQDNEMDMYARDLDKATLAVEDILDAELQMGTYFLVNISRVELRDFLISLKS